MESNHCSILSKINDYNTPLRFMAFAIDVMVCYFLINFEKYVSSLLINELKCGILFNGYFVTHNNA